MLYYCFKLFVCFTRILHISKQGYGTRQTKKKMYSISKTFIKLFKLKLVHLYLKRKHISTSTDERIVCPVDILNQNGYVEFNFENISCNS